MDQFVGKILVVGIFASLVLGIVGRGGSKIGSSLQPPCGFPAIYNFGDSNSDTGGFSAAISYVRAAYPGKPTGRLSNGHLIIDFIAEHLGLPYLTPYLDSVGSNFSHGANFAVGGATIRRQNDSFICPFYLGIQITQFQQFKDRTIELYNQGKNTRGRLPRPTDFSKALYTIDIGQNDLIRASFSNDPNRELGDIINQIATAVQHLYDQGARVFWIHNAGPLGCLPESVEVQKYLDKSPRAFDKYGCAKARNELAMEFNRQLKQIVIQLRRKLGRAVLTWVDIYTAKYELIGKAKNLGFIDPFKICNTHEETINKTKVEIERCPNPWQYVSWDGVHFTEAANQLIANSIASGLFSEPPLPITHTCYGNALI